MGVRGDVVDVVDVVDLKKHLNAYHHGISDLCGGWASAGAGLSFLLRSTAVAWFRLLTGQSFPFWCLHFRVAIHPACISVSGFAFVFGLYLGLSFGRAGELLWQHTGRVIQGSPAYIPQKEG